MTAINKLKEQSSEYFFSGKFAQGYGVIKQCVQLQPQQPQHFINKALYEYKLGNVKTAFTDLNRAITLDYLNYQAYFNLFSMQMQSEQYEAAFKNICCCLSILHLLKAQKDGSIDHVEQAIDYCFNNKEARLFKSILKIEGKKNIEALNQINYALYLAPSNQYLQTVQEKVYRLMGMKELKLKNSLFQRPKYDRLETNKEVPPQDNIKHQIEKLLKNFNSIHKSLDSINLFKITFLTLPKTLESIKEQNFQVSRKRPLKFYLAQTFQNPAQEQSLNLIDSSSHQLKDKLQRQSTTNNSEHIALSSKQEQRGNPEQAQKMETFFVYDSSFSNLSVSNISQNSNIKMNKIKANLIDFNQTCKYFNEEKMKNSSPSYCDNILQSSISEDKEKGNSGLRLPLRLNELKSNEKIVVTLQRTVVNNSGQSEQIEELYQVIESNKKLQLVKIQKAQ